MSRDARSIGRHEKPSAHDTTKIFQSTLPGDTVSDLIDSFKFYDKNDEGFISVSHFRNILHNFGFSKMTKKEIDDELKRSDIDLNRRTQIDFDSVRVAVTYRWNKGGRDEEARDCFKVFDKRDKNFLNSHDLKTVLPNYLEFPVTDSDIQELMADGDPNGTGAINFRDFLKIYN